MYKRSRREVIPVSNFFCDSYDYNIKTLMTTASILASESVEKEHVTVKKDQNRASMLQKFSQEALHISGRTSAFAKSENHGHKGLNGVAPHGEQVSLQDAKVLAT